MNKLDSLIGSRIVQALVYKTEFEFFFDSYERRKQYIVCTKKGGVIRTYIYRSQHLNLNH